MTPTTREAADAGSDGGPGPLRLAYQSFGQVAGMEAYQGRLEEIVRAASPESALRILRLPSTIVAGKGFASAQALDVPALLRSIAGAVDGGVEAVAVGNGFDPGLWEARELFDIPVLGMFETVAAYGLRVGWRLGVLCSGNSGVARVEELAARYGIGSRLVRPAAAGVRVPDVVAGFGDPQIAERVLEAARRSVAVLAERGADVVMVASGALDVFLASSGRPDVGLPVLPSVTILVRELEAAAGLARLGVPFVSRAGRFASPPPEILTSLRRAPD
ncbi:MAG: allantoin racemase [Chloroflexota bacterium]|jgi:Asp/Glu/hydantoin racemase|nr:allantoin racemase [Chloroflexota bacterium]